VVVRGRLALGERGRRSKTFLLERRNRTEVVANIAPSLQYYTMVRGQADQLACLARQWLRGWEYLTRHLRESQIYQRFIRKLLAIGMKNDRVCLECLGYRLHYHPILAVLDCDDLQFRREQTLRDAGGYLQNFSILLLRSPGVTSSSRALRSMVTRRSHCRS
jgi:hypothetical protein